MTKPTTLMAAMKWFTASNMLCLVLYALLLAGVVGGLFYVRHWALMTYATSTAHNQWQQWRSEAARQEAGGGPVQRRTPRSLAPPVLVITQEYFVSFMLIAVVLSSAIFATLVFMIRGAARSPGRIYRDDDLPAAAHPIPREPDD